MQWFAQFTAMIEASSVDNDKYRLSQLMAQLISDVLAMELVDEFEINADNYAPAIAALEGEFLEINKNAW